MCSNKDSGQPKIKKKIKIKFLKTKKKKKSQKVETRAQGETVPDRQPGYLRCAKPSSPFSSLHEHFIYGIAIKSLAFEICTSMYILSH